MIGLKDRVNSLLAGIMIGFCGYAYLIIENKYLGALLFSFGLLTIISKGFYLYSAEIYTLQFTPMDVLKKIDILIFNFIGASIIGLAFSVFRDTNTNALWELKLQRTLPEAFILSFFCGILMYLAVTLYAKEKNPMCVMMPIMLFLLTGCEHCCANVFYISMLTNVTWAHMGYFLVTIIGNTCGSLLICHLEKVGHATEKLNQEGE